MRFHFVRSVLLHCIYWLFTFNILIAQDFPPVPNPPRLVNDFANFLEADKNQILNQQLESIYQATKNQITIVSIDHIGDYDIADYANQLGRKWGIGNKETNSGLLILIVRQNRKIWFATGYGLEGVLPDITCQRIIKENIKPFFKEGKFYEGLQSSVFHIVEIFAKNDDGKNADRTKFYTDFLNGNTQYKNLSNGTKELSTGKVILLIIGLIIVLALSSRRRGGFGGGMFLGGGFGGSLGGGSDFGNSSFGGGSFGGGGSGGSW